MATSSQARERIRAYIRPTPLYPSSWLSAVSGTRVSLKIESLQLTGSFKIRGALNALLRLSSGTSVVTASAGNHGQAIACAARMLGLTAHVFTPRDAPAAKIDGIRQFGATLDTTAADYDAAERLAVAFARESGSCYISPYNHDDVIAGAGTVGIEIAESAPDVDLIVAPLGGGGLASGLALAVAVPVIGVEAEASPAFSASLAAGHIASIQPRPTLADGLSGNLEQGSMTFPLVRDHVAGVVTVTEGDIAAAMHGLAARERLVAEGAGAAAAAAVLARKVPRASHIAVIVSGGNVDLATFIAAATTPGPQALRG